mmetsp:Transcript_54480/g.129864  ORF Transcript_54480/g.129864 Transcript_54480/m.129864 type:complete len:792 (+) Transcript_54480:127-2502(+)
MIPELSIGSEPMFPLETGPATGDEIQAKKAHARNGHAPTGHLLDAALHASTMSHAGGSYAQAHSRGNTGSTGGKSFKDIAFELLMAAAEALDQEHQQLLEKEKSPLQPVNKGGSMKANSVSTTMGDELPIFGLYDANDVTIISLDPEKDMTEMASVPSNCAPMLSRQPGEMDHPAFRQHHKGSNLGLFALLPDWEEEELNEADAIEDFEAQRIARMQYRAGLKKLLDTSPEFRSGRRSSGNARDWCSSTCIASPVSQKRMTWDIIGAILLGFEALIIPMAVFDLPEDGLLFAARVFLMFYWSLDMIGSFTVGYHRADGEIEMRCKHVAWRYFTTWFFLDLIIVSLDWVTYGAKLFLGFSPLTSESSGLARMSKVGRVIRVLRMVRLARLVKLRRIVSGFQDSIGLEKSAILFSIARNLMRIWLMNHYLACIWFWIGTRQDQSWLEHRQSSSWWYNYLLSVHWSLANFTPGSSGVQPTTEEEFLFAVIVLFLAMVVFSVFVSSTTSLINRLVGMKASQHKQLFLLKAFLRQHNFDALLRDRVLRYVRAASGGHKETIKRGDVELLNLLSEHLREEVQMSLHVGTIARHPLFELLSLASPQLVRKLSVEALSEARCSSGDMIFGIGEEFDKMGFLEEGILVYSVLPMTADVEFLDQQKDADLQFLSMQAGKDLQMFCEAPLWTHWRTKGNLQADTDCTILELSGHAFRTCMKRHHSMLSVVIPYAKAFLEVLNQARNGLYDSPLTDLQGVFLFEEQIQGLFATPWMQDGSSGAGSRSMRNFAFMPSSTNPVDQ